MRETYSDDNARPGESKQWLINAIKVITEGGYWGGGWCWKAQFHAPGHSHCFTAFVLQKLRDGEQHLQPTLEGGQRNVSEMSGTGTTHQLARWVQKCQGRSKGGWQRAMSHCPISQGFRAVSSVGSEGNKPHKLVPDGIICVSMNGGNLHLQAQT